MRTQVVVFLTQMLCVIVVNSRPGFVHNAGQVVMTNSHSFSVFVGIKPANRVWCINTGGKLCYDIEYTVERTIAPQAKNFETYTAC